MNRMSKTIAIAATVAGLAAAPIAFAQDDTDTGQPAQSQGAQEMMQDGDMPMMGMMGMMAKMNEMMSTCNTMMQAMKSDMPSEGGEQPDNG